VAIWLIRHGETAGNANRIVQVPETPLSERGIAQAERLGSRLADAPVAHILSSDYSRAAMTAERVAATTGRAIESEPLLRERNFGDMRGRSYDDLEVDLFDADFHPPAGESWEQFHARVDSAWERIRSVAARAAGDLAVVTHGLVCHSLTLRHLELAGEDAPLGFANTSLTLIEAGPPWRVQLLNCTAHLDAGPSDDANGGRV